MTLNIRDKETDALVRRLATLTGESLTGAVKSAVEEKIAREERRQGKASLEELMEIVRTAWALPVLDNRSADEIIGYDEHGLPT